MWIPSGAASEDADFSDMDLLRLFEEKHRVARGFGHKCWQWRVRLNIEVGPDKGYSSEVFLQHRPALLRPQLAKGYGF